MKNKKEAASTPMFSPALSNLITPKRLRKEAQETQRRMHGPSIAPQCLELLADLIDVADLQKLLPCPKCGADCDPCSGAHPAYDLKEGRLLRIVVVDYLCRECPDIFVQWSKLDADPTNEEKSDGDDEDGD